MTFRRPEQVPQDLNLLIKQYLNRYPDSNTDNVIQAQDTGTVPVTIKAVASTNADLLQIRSSANVLRIGLEADGQINIVPAGQRPPFTLGPGASGNLVLGLNAEQLSGFYAADFAPYDAQYLTLAANNTLSNERRFTVGTGLLGVDGGTTYTLNINTGTLLNGYINTGNINQYTVPYYAHPVSYYGSSTSQLSPGSTQGISLANSSTVIRSPLASGEVFIVTRVGIRVNAGSAAGSYTVSGGLRLYPNLDDAGSSVNYIGASVTVNANSNGHGVTGGNYFTPICYVTGTSTSSFNAYLSAHVDNPGNLGATGHTVMINGYIVNQSIAGQSIVSRP